MRLILLLAAALPILAQSPAPLSADAAGAFAIWPGVPPGSENWTWRRQVTDRGGSRMVRNVVAPAITMYKPPDGKANGASVIIAPGGAFRFLMVDYEGVELARWLTARGITAFVLEYRLIHTPEDEPGMAAYLEQLNRSYATRDTRGENPPKYDEPVLAAIKIAEEDGRQAIRYVRQHAAEWSLDPRRIGIVGFSAGGAVVMGAVMWHDAASRPDFAAPIYPTYRSVTPVPDDAPPLFIAIADDDKLISPSSSARIFMAWHAAGKSAEFHVFRQGGHGFGMKTQNRPSDGWLYSFHSWMNSLGLLNAGISRLYVFGDSYSDTGAGYVDGDGPTAVAYLASRLGLKLMTPSAPDANSHSLNFAVSGAQTGRGAGRKVKDSLLGYGMANQVDDFVARAQSGSLKFDSERTLFYFAGGLNDRRLPSAETTANLSAEIRKLYGVGARRFSLALLPTAIPEFSEVGQRLNPELKRLPGELEPSLPGAQIKLSNWGGFFDEVRRNPSAYGIENTKDRCAGRALFNEDATPCANPAGHFYYHAGHPSTAVHKSVGDMLFGELPSLQ